MAIQPVTHQFELTPPEPSPKLAMADYLELAKAGASLEIIRQYMELKERNEATEARKAFIEAKSKFFAEEIHISKDKFNKQYGSNYSSLGNLVNTVRPYLGRYGFDVRWDVDQSDKTTIKVTCILTHCMGHSESNSMIVPPDKSGGDHGKNEIQQIKSAITYARNLTFETVCGLASTDGTVNVDDDGNSYAPAGSSIGDEEFVGLVDGIKNAGNDDELKKLYFYALGVAEKAKDSKAKEDFRKAKNERWRQLHAGK